MSTNPHIENYLDYYLGIDRSPGFAVLINGAWGTGKTFFINEYLSSKDIKNISDCGDSAKRALQQTGRDNSKPALPGYIYVSLNGLGSTEEFETALFISAFPQLSGRGAKISSKLARAGLKFLNFDPEFTYTDIFNLPKVDVVILDDLERCQADIDVTLAFINGLVEHTGSKVVVLSNLDRVESLQRFSTAQEKVFGKKLEFKSPISVALTNFISEVTHEPAKEFLIPKTNAITFIFNLSKQSSLRILHQCIWDFERLFKVLSDKHRKNLDMLEELLELFLVLSIEYRSGGISDCDLKHRQVLELGVGLEGIGKTSKISDLREKYTNINLASPALSNDLLSAIIHEGVVDGNAIGEYLDQTRYFRKPEEEPSWRTVWYGWERSECEFNPALEKLEADFRNRGFEDTGIILHVFANRLWLSEENLLELSADQVIAECEAYVDDLLSQDRLVPLKPHDSNDLQSSQHPHMGYDGLAYHRSEEPEFQRLYEYLKAKRHEAFKNRLPNASLELIDLMKSKPQDLFFRLNVTTRQEHDFAFAPVMSYVSVNQMIDILLSLYPRDFREVLMSFRQRYDGRWDKDDMLQELSWLEDVAQGLHERAADLSPLRRSQIEFVTRGELAQPLAKLRDLKTEIAAKQTIEAGDD